MIISQIETKKSKKNSVELRAMLVLPSRLRGYQKRNKIS